MKRISAIATWNPKPKNEQKSNTHYKSNFKKQTKTDDPCINGTELENNWYKRII